MPEDGGGWHAHLQFGELRLPHRAQQQEGGVHHVGSMPAVVVRIAAPVRLLCRCQERLHLSAVQLPAGLRGAPMPPINKCPHRMRRQRTALPQASRQTAGGADCLQGLRTSPTMPAVQPNGHVSSSAAHVHMRSTRQQPGGSGAAPEDPGRP